MVGHGERQIHVLFELAAIIGEGEAGLERHRLGRDDVAAPDLDRIEAGFGGREIDHALDDVGRLRPAVAAVGAHRMRVGEDRRHVHMDGRRAIDAGQGAEIGDRRALSAALQIGADIGDVRHPEAEEPPLLVEGELGLGDEIAPLCVGQERFRAGARPFHRTAGDFRCQQHQGDLVVDRRLHAEAAADVAGDDAHLVLRHLQHGGGELGAEVMGALQGRVDRVAVLDGVVIADRAARLHGGGGHPVDREAVAHDVLGGREGGVRRRLVTAEMGEADVVRAVVPDAWRAGLDGVRRGYHRG